MIDLRDLTRALASGLIFTLLCAGILAGCAWYRDSAVGRGYDTAGIFKRQDIPSQYRDQVP